LNIPDRKYVGFKDDKEERLLTLAYEKRDITEAMRDSQEPKDISDCLHAGILPTCYENMNIKCKLCCRKDVWGRATA